jgi:two-component sensor histidine kinase
MGDVESTSGCRSVTRDESPWSPGAWDARHLRLAVDAAGIALWSWNVDTDRLTMDDRAYTLWGVQPTSHVTFEDLSAHIHPADRDRVRAAFSATRAVLGHYEIDFRILVGDVVRWISARGQGEDIGMVGRVMFGIFLDVTGRKQAEEGSELLAGEMSHRVKNLLAIASGLTRLTSQSAKTPVDMARELTARLAALGRAHDMVRPLPGQQGSAALLGDLISILLAPYDDLGAFSGRIRVAVPRMGVGERAATSLALIVHELATNSVKYGCLSSDSGTLDISCTDTDPMISVVWMERGGPAVAPPKDAPGFGSRLLRSSVVGQLGGSLAVDWAVEGAVVTLKLDKERLSH